MTINEMFDELENKVRDTYIVTLKYKYDFEEKYTIENQILVYDSVDDSYIWQNDWNEGQTDVEVLGYMILGDVNTQKIKEIRAYKEGYDEGYDEGYIVGEAQADAWLVIEEHINDTLDKIRAEIEKLQPNLRPEQMTDYDYAMVDVVNDIVAIIDKYKVKRSDKG